RAGRAEQLHPLALRRAGGARGGPRHAAPGTHRRAERHPLLRGQHTRRPATDRRRPDQGGVVSILDQVTDRLRRGLAVETVRTPDGWRMLTPGALPACGIVVGAHETYRVEYVGRRPGGDIDVVVAASPHD